MTFIKLLLRGVLPLVALGVFGGLALRASPAGRVVIAGNVPASVAAAALMGRLAGTAPVQIVLTLPLRNQAALEDLIGRLSDPADPLYGHYLTSAQFAARFSPTQTDYAAVAAFARAQGLTVTRTHTNRVLLDVSGPARAAEAAFHVHLNHYQTAEGRVFHAPDAAPSLPRALAGKVMGVEGLSDAAVRRPHARRVSSGAGLQPALSGKQIGTGPNGGLTPADIKTAYNLSSLPLDGSGQTLAVFELDGYTASDISAYETQFGLRSVPLQNILVDGVSNIAGDGADEVTLDIELQIALAPGAAQVLVYEAPNTDAGVLDCYSQIAEDNLAKQISTSWGLDEPENTPSTIQAENAIFQQMAAQGQTIYASSGDSGAYDSGSKRDGLRVDDPASQPYVCGVGGTTLTTSGAGGPYTSEQTWNGGSVRNGGGGGGISSVWPIPSWQQAAATAASGASSAMRNVPDVSLDADPNTGYAIYFGGSWTLFGGTSAASPLWAGFTALVNQQRAANGLAPLGQANPALYPLLASARYGADFHDIADGSTNLFYPAVAGYDDATGLGTFNGANLLADLAPKNVSGHTHVLWTNASGQVSVWNYDTAGAYTYLNYGPFSGWTAKAIADGSDGKTRVLWTTSAGQASIWNLNNATGDYSHQEFGPFSDWVATGLSVGTDGTTHVLWTNPSGQASLWNYDTAGAYTYLNYGPFSGWTAKAIADGSDGKTRVLWTTSAGQASIWSLNNATGDYSHQEFGPFADWMAQTLSVSTNNTTHVLWTNASGQVSVWNYDTAGAYTYLNYGPFSGWTAKAIADGSDGKTRVLWTTSAGQASIWNLNNMTGDYPHYEFGPYSDWMAQTLSTGP